MERPLRLHAPNFPVVVAVAVDAVAAVVVDGGAVVAGVPRAGFPDSEGD